MRGLLRSISAPARWFFAALRERDSIIFIICLLTLLYVLGLVVPQRGSVPAATWVAWRNESPRLVHLLERTGLADVYHAPGTYAVLAFFFLSLGAVLVERIPRLVGRTRLEYGIPLAGGAIVGRKGTVAFAADLPEEAVRRAAAFLGAAGYRLHSQGAGAVRAVRFRFAPLGFVLFHGAFAFLLAGGVLLDVTRFSGIVNVAEGEPFYASTGQYTDRPRVPRFGGARPDISFTVGRVRPRSEGGFPLSLQVDLLVRGDSSPRVAGINEPVDVGTTSMLVLSAGAAPLFTCEGNGATDGAFVKLVPNASERTRFFFEPCGLDIVARPYAPDETVPPDAAGQGVMLASAGVGRLEDVANSGIEVAVRGPDGAIARGVLKPGASLATPDGRRVLHMPELRYYAKLQIVDERGGALLWTGFLLGIVGLVLRLLMFRREVVVVADPSAARVLVGTAADVAGWRPDALFEGLAKALGAPCAAVQRHDP